MTTKAGNLARLRGSLRGARIAPLAYFTVAQWREDAQRCLSQIASSLGDGPLIVRSSCRREDGAGASHAGEFLSLLNVSPADLPQSIDQVITSYGTPEAEDEVLVQPMLQDVQRAGVVFSHDPNTCAPYIVANWSEGGDTGYVTGGYGGRTWQGAALSPYGPPDEIAGVVPLIRELQGLFGEVPLDCEFAVTREAGNDVLWLLQVRPLHLARTSESPEAQARRLALIAEKVERGMREHPFLMGRRTVYGVMPDWNPGEIIGIRPKPLSLSLYRDLVTDAIWAYQRNNYGYRNLRSFPLMPHFFGLPYVDVRLSFNSFVPADLDDTLAARLVDYYIDRLLAEPELHDKVEFEIVFSCYTLDFPQRVQRLAEAGFRENEQALLAHSLRRLTNGIVHPETGLWKTDAAKLETLNRRREVLLGSGLDTLARIYWLLEDAKRYGTLPFAGLARAGFVAVQMLRSLLAVGVFTQADYDAFMGGLTTVSGQLGHDMASLERDVFLAKYGHLRPGTYDILSPRYDEAPELYFDWANKPPAPAHRPAFVPSEQQATYTEALLREHGLHCSAQELFSFIRSGIELRELAKFHFTRNLSDALSLAAAYAEQHGISREDMAYCHIGALQELHIAAADPAEVLMRSIEQGKAQYQETLRVALPPVILNPESVWAFELGKTEPNFITQKQVTAPVSDCDAGSDLKGRIVCIPNADPGFDWLFSHAIAGLITAWGGVNSHMAIRAGELGLPAVIGCGEASYRHWAQARRLRLDCAARRVEVLA
ncbi:phosphoenolpyruvate synthase [Mangrovimicrobium sediminis]|uniref:Phosphoenolpyruvate synthase n=2 Tax=Mangrovimicrobium sediminis TaxID=2562682 RepID=A0A4Z0M0D0_9GAMM|nr:phosphoenolpyruvate synthase [Haliea sp. SAOS-164]